MNKIVPWLAVFLIAATYFFLVPDEHPDNSSLSMTAVSNVSGRQTAEKSESDFAGISAVPIREIRVGMRVPVENPEIELKQSDFESWRKFTLEGIDEKGKLSEEFTLMRASIKNQRKAHTTSLGHSLCSTRISAAKANEAAGGAFQVSSESNFQILKFSSTLTKVEKA